MPKQTFPERFSPSASPLGKSGGPGGVVYLGHFFVVSVDIFHVVARISVGIFPVEPAFQQAYVPLHFYVGHLMKHVAGFQTQDPFDVEKGFRLYMFPDAVGDDKKLSFRVVDDVGYVEGLNSERIGTMTAP